MRSLFVASMVFILIVVVGCSKEPSAPVGQNPQTAVSKQIVHVILEITSDVVKGKSAAFVIPSQNFRDEEYQTPRQILEKEGVQITVFSSSTAEAKGMLGKVLVTPDKTLEQFNDKEFDAVIFIGGTGAKEYFDSNAAHMIARNTVKDNKILGAICLAPRILANSGVLTGKTATIVPSEGAYLKTKMVRYEDKKNVCIDGKIITANGPEAAGEFGQAILNALRGK
ncbi:MAG: DJ-1/PfpI family protein [Planctomycetes bacterium]|nr:DJ-1/PfpI family protein [Planctomycetota bacterium]